MNDDFIVEGNKLIAEFMTTYEKDDIGHDFGHLHSPFYGGIGAMWSKHSKPRLIPQLKYHKSWDWLMPVVEKIEKTPNPSYGYEFIKYGKRCVCIHDYHTNKDVAVINITTENTFKEATWLLVVKFIEWYNKQ